MRRSVAHTVLVFVLCSAAWGAERPPAVSPILTSPRPAPASSGATYEYQLIPFHYSLFESRKEFEKYLDEFGEEGWFSIFHFGFGNPQSERRLLMRPVGGVPLEVEFDIKKNKKTFSNNVEVWVKAFDKLGKRGKIAVAQFTQSGKTYGVTEAHTLDGELRTFRFRRIVVGKRHEVGPAEFKKAVRELAEDGYVPFIIGFPDQSGEADYNVVGIKETTADIEAEVELKFATANLGTTPKKWTKTINKKARKGYQLVEVELSDSSGKNFIVTFARVKINGEFTRRKCVVEPILVNALDQMTQNLNSRGAAGYEKIYETFGGGVNSFQFVLCRDKGATLLSSQR